MLRVIGSDRIQCECVLIVTCRKNYTFLLLLSTAAGYLLIIVLLSGPFQIKCLFPKHEYMHVRFSMVPIQITSYILDPRRPCVKCCGCTADCPVTPESDKVKCIHASSQNKLEAKCHTSVAQHSKYDSCLHFIAPSSLTAIKVSSVRTV